MDRGPGLWKWPLGRCLCQSFQVVLTDARVWEPWSRSPRSWLGGTLGVKALSAILIQLVWGAACVLRFLSFFAETVFSFVSRIFIISC